MFRFIASLLVVFMLCAVPSFSFSEPKATAQQDCDPVEHLWIFGIGDAEDSAAIKACGTMSLSFTLAGSDVVEVYQIEDKADIATSGTIIITFTASSTIPHVLNPVGGWLKARATTSATGGSRIRVRRNIQVASNNQTAVLLGGQNNIDDVANPNDIDGDGVFTDEIICTRTNADCFYLSTTTGWWAAISTDGVADTNWSALQEKRIFEAQLEGDAGYNVAAFVSTVCVWLQNGNELTAVAFCNDPDTKISWSRDVLITSMVWIAKTQNGVDPAQGTADGCTVKLATGIAGFTDIPGSELDIPSSSVLINEGTPYSVDIGVIVPAYTSVTMPIRDGDFCQSGTTPATCDCGASWGYSQVEIWGILL